MLMIRKEHGMKTGKPDFIKMRHDDYVITVARHKRFPWLEHSEHKYVYFLYITRMQKGFVNRDDANTAGFNILCFCQIYSSFYHLMKIIEPVLREYILDSRKIVEIVMLCEELHEAYDDFNQENGE
mgnify:CR=1 FL=1